ncbi:MAG: D-2-hydroxyacid dehydrogenase [Gammaproteobacteria bacterium]|nr:D-2-hydroxyacid dehydrogenase [Gammaproteobacteria bacterium]
MNRNRLNIFIASPLEPEQVERIRAVDPERLEVVHDPDVLPPKRYEADHTGPADFRRTPEQQARWRAHLGRADILWDFPPRNPDGSGGLAYAPNVRWIQGTSSGVGRTVEALGLLDSDLLITTARGVHGGPLAEFVFLILLAHVRKFAHLADLQRRHLWVRFCGEELEGSTLAIIGAGEVGRMVARVGRSFGMRIVALASPGSRRSAAELGVDALHPNNAMHEMLAETDALVLSVPHTPETDRLIDDAALRALKPGAVLVNVARGGVVDEPALLEALGDGRIALAGLDVFADEPLPPDSPFWDMPNVIVSPHSSANAASENRKITDIFRHNLRCYLDGRLGEMRNVFRSERMY